MDARSGSRTRGEGCQGQFATSAGGLKTSAGDLKVDAFGGWDPRLRLRHRRVRGGSRSSEVTNAVEFDPGRKPGAERLLAEPGHPSHIVQFYESEESLFETVARFLGA